MQFRKLVQRNALCAMVVSLVILSIAGCNLFSPGDTGAVINVDDSADMKELDLLILESLYPKGAVAELYSAEEEAGLDSSRNGFDPDNFTDGLDLSPSEDDTWEISGWYITEDATDDAGNPVYEYDGDTENLIYIWEAEDGRSAYVYSGGSYLLMDSTENAYCVYFEVMNGETVYTTLGGEVIVNSLDPEGNPIVDANGSEVDLDNLDLDLEVHRRTRAVTPREAYESATSPYRFPADDDEYLTPAGEPDPTVEGEYFSMDKAGPNAYEITYTLIKRDGLSSLDRVITVYYVGEDSWEGYTSKQLETEGWESETVYYQNGKVGDRTNISQFTGTEAKGFFSGNPDFDPFTITAGDPSFEYSDGIADTFVWGDVGTGSYSSVAMTEVYPSEQAMNTGNAESTETNFYTEAMVSSFPAILGSVDANELEVRASMIYYQKVLDEEASTAMEIVTASSRYFDGDSFLMKDKKSLLHTTQAGASYPYEYHHKYFYTVDGSLTFSSIYRFFEESTYDVTFRDSNAGVNDTAAKRVETELNLESGTWDGTCSIYAAGFTEEQDSSIAFAVQLVGAYLHYETTVDGELLVIAPDANGQITIDLPGGGTFVGEVSESGILSGIYTPLDGEPVYI